MTPPAAPSPAVAVPFRRSPRNGDVVVLQRIQIELLLKLSVREQARRFECLKFHVCCDLDEWKDKMAISWQGDYEICLSQLGLPFSSLPSEVIIFKAARRRARTRTPPFSPQRKQLQHSPKKRRARESVERSLQTTPHQLAIGFT
ncbi:hypothetical protein YC2023_113049 [Brassica napus]